MATAKKIIAVVGATGIQGSSVAHAFLASPDKWHVRCLTRHPSSTKAQELAKLGCEVVQADLTDQASLSRAFDGAHAIFVNTDFWAPYRSSVTSGVSSDESCKIGHEVEVAHGKNAAIVAAGVPTLERFVYSALGPMNRASNGKYPQSHHWETKAAIVDYIEAEHPELARKMATIYIGAYTTNNLLVPKLDSSTGEYSVLLPCKPTTRFPIIDTAESTGIFVKALVEGEQPNTKLLAYDSYLSVEQIIQAWSNVTGKQAKLVEGTVEEMHEMTRLPLEVLVAPAFIEEYGYTAGVSGVIEPPQLKTKVQTRGYEDWLRTRDMEELLGENKVVI
ncbi:Uu.00g007130.m01.CDS01 [Anthostomella pinea]|uniref:Uu.00g007130.m01.CDS01 n=1 Tax=Anthostomella pinea TaxID=933095 RepID=A0AAI8VWY6_9PEZI|nr:Uu.00g007130.m01.CDS01 [Anthostomella pinea]